MIADIIRLTGLYVLIYGFARQFFKTGAFIVKWFFWVGMLLIIVGNFGPPLTRLTTDLHNVSTVYTAGKQGVQDGVEAIQTLPENLDNLPVVGLKDVSKYPPSISLKEKLWPFNKNFFTYPLAGETTQSYSPPDHHGLDIACDEGTIVKTARPGVVSEVGANEVYGNFIIVDHGGGWRTLYAHLSKFGVPKGRNLFENDAIGLSGNTGKSTGPHLHFEIRAGDKTVDPKDWMK